MIEFGKPKAKVLIDNEHVKLKFYLQHLQILAVGLVRLVQALDLGVALVGQGNAGTRVAGVHL